MTRGKKVRTRVTGEGGRGRDNALPPSERVYLPPFACVCFCFASFSAIERMRATGMRRRHWRMLFASGAPSGAMATLHLSAVLLSFPSCLCRSGARTRLRSSFAATIFWASSFLCITIAGRGLSLLGIRGYGDDRAVGGRPRSRHAQCLGRGDIAEEEFHWSNLEAKGETSSNCGRPRGVFLFAK